MTVLFVGVSLGNSPDHPDWSGLPPVADTALRLAHGLGDAIEDDRQQDDAQPADGRQPHVESADAAQHHLSQSTNRDHRGDDDHRQ